jgi:cell wall-associated NlpC family hydrolase
LKKAVAVATLFSVALANMPTNIKAEETLLKDDILNATLLMEELLNDEYSHVESSLQQDIENNNWNYTLTMDSFYENGNPYDNMDYQQTIAVLCTVMNHSSATIADISFLKMYETPATIEKIVPVKTDRYKEVQEGLYEKTGVAYITEDGTYPLYKETEDGYYIIDGEQEIALDRETEDYATVTLELKSTDELMADVGIDFSSVENEYSQRLGEIMASGIDETSLSQSVFVQIQSGIQLLSDDEKKQLETAEIEAEGNRLTLVNVASSLIGRVPYQWGGKSSRSGYDTSWYTFENGQQKGLDCSGYIQWVFRTAGYSEDIWKQLTSTSTIMQTCEQIPQSDLQIGDLGILNSGETTNHVGMYIGNGYYIHCNAGDRTVSISKPEFTLFYRVAGTDSEILSPQTDGDVASSITYTNEELYLIAQTVWHEARGEGSNGWIAVAEVIKNRVLNPLYPETVQDVIYQTGQFSYNEQIANMIPNETEIEVVKMVLDGKVSILGDDNVLWFKNPTITDDYEADIDSTSEIGDWNGHKPYKLIGSHMFYK